MSKNSFGSQATLKVSADSYTIHRLDAVYKKYPQAERLPFSFKILLENLLRTEDGINVKADDIAALAQWDAKAEPTREIAFTGQDVRQAPCPMQSPAFMSSALPSIIPRTLNSSNASTRCLTLLANRSKRTTTTASKRRPGHRPSSDPVGAALWCSIPDRCIR